MGWRFNKRLKVLPGIFLNISKSGISLTVGGKGATFTIGPTHTTKRFTIPGTGWTYTKRKKR